VAGSGDFDAGELDRSELQLIAADPPRSAWVKSAEDTVLRKLQWYRAGGEVSDRQWSDVLGILMAQGDRLDQSYLRQWADALGFRISSIGRCGRPGRPELRRQRTVGNGT